MRVLPLSVCASLTIIAAVYAAPPRKAPASVGTPAAESTTVAAPVSVTTSAMTDPLAAVAARMVWATPAGIYHCPADQWFGRTSDGHFMNEDDARARGYRSNTGHACNAPT